MSTNGRCSVSLYTLLDALGDVVCRALGADGGLGATLRAKCPMESASVAVRLVMTTGFGEAAASAST